MARIRTVKPEFFKHFDLFQLEESEKMPIRLAFQGLWLCADKEGRFKWQAPQLKLDILPYDKVDFTLILETLCEHGFIVKYQYENKLYGFIPSFREHQRITGTEAQAESKLPNPKDGILMEATRKQQSDSKEIPDLLKDEVVTDCKSDVINKETTEKQQGNTQDDWKGKEGKGRERNKERERSVEERDISVASLKKLRMPFGDFFSKVWIEWKLYKWEQHNFKYKNEGSEQSALHELVSMAKGVEDDAIAIIKQSMSNGWKGFFELKKNNIHGKQKQPTGGEVSTESAFSKIDKLYSQNGKI